MRVPPPQSDPGGFPRARRAATGRRISVLRARPALEHGAVLGGIRNGIRIAALGVVGFCASFAHAGDPPTLGERDTRDALRMLADSSEASRAELCARLVGDPNPRWSAITALECVAAVEDRLQKAVAERDKQGAKMFAFFVGRVVRDFENRAKFTEFRVMEIENRALCGTVQEWTRALDAFDAAGRTASARVTGDSESAAAVADRVRRLVALAKRPSQQAAVISALRGDAARVLAPDAHAWAGPTSDRELATAAMRLLCLVPDAVDVTRLVTCAQSVDPVVRRVAYKLFATVATVPAIDALIDRLAVEEGVPAGEIVTHLHALTEETFASAAAWREWWTAHRDGWKPEAIRVAQAEKIARQTYSRYFGLELRSARVLFVIDRSGSMSYGIGHKSGVADVYSELEKTKMEVAVRELVTAVQGLDERTSFNILSYSTNFETFQRRPVRATRENREKAARWIAKLTPDGQTNLAGSLLAALENTRPSAGAPDEAIADTLVVLTDGAPNCGPIAYENDALAELRRLDSDRMVTIHAIFLGVDGDEAFMRSLAKDHGGQFIHHTR